MPRSRLISLLVAVFLGFHLQMGTVELACATGVMAGSTGAMTGMTMPATEAPADGANQGETPCTAPGVPTGCKLMAPCVTGVFESARERLASPAAHAAVPQHLIALVPISRSFPPEPPPPRA